MRKAININKEQWTGSKLVISQVTSAGRRARKNTECVRWSTFSNLNLYI